MISLWIIILLVYLIAGLIALRYPRISYSTVAIGSSFTLYLLFTGFIHAEPVATYFILISSTVWLFLSLFSLSYERSRLLAMSFAFTTGAMLIILLSRDAITFLLGWEGMTIASFLSIYLHGDSKKSAYMFLVFGELSTVLITSGFAWASSLSGSFAFSSWVGTVDWDWIYLLIASGFTVKMAMFPFHIWLPEAHSKAPANMSAQLSAIMTLMGLYGLVMFLTPSFPSAWVGAFLLIMGGITAIIGALHAAVCDHVKILPAYSTVENDGVLMAMVGAVIVTFQLGSTTVAGFVLVALLFYAFAHSIAKSLLFAVAGHIERDGEYLGGTYRITRWTAFAGFLAAMSLAGVPPLPGFVGEWAALESLFQSFYLADMAVRIATIIIGALVALTAGISIIAMSKYIVHGVDRRKTGRAEIGDTGFAIGAAVILLMGLFPQYVFSLLSPATVEIMGVHANNYLGSLLGIPDGMLIISGAGFGVLSPTMIALFLVVNFGIVYVFMRNPITRRRVARPWSGGLENEEYPTRGHSSILLLTQRWVFKTERMKQRDASVNFYESIARSYLSFSERFRIALMPGNDRRYILYILIALLTFLAVVYAIP